MQKSGAAKEIIRKATASEKGEPKGALMDISWTVVIFL